MFDAEKTVDTILDAIDVPLKAFHERLRAVENRKPEKGEKGERGEPGIGLQGERGPEGPAGRDGRDGLQGAPGPEGINGFDGKDGRDGIDGKDGRDALDIEVPEALCEMIAKSIRLLAETPDLSALAAPEPRIQPAVNVHLPQVVMPELKLPDVQMQVNIPEQKPPVIHLPNPGVRKTRTTVTKHDQKGRIVEFEKEEI